MKHEISFGEKLIWLLESFVTKKISRAKVSYQGQKKFSDVVAYIKSGKFGKDIGSRVLTDTDDGKIFRYNYDFGKGRGFKVTIIHQGELITSMEYERDSSGAIYTIKRDLNVMDDKLPDYVPEKNAPEVVIPKVVYSKKSLKDLVNIFDKELQELSKNPTPNTLATISDVKNAINDKINEKPIAERTPFKKPLGDMSMYIEALSMQINNGNTQFVGTYLPQIESALSELASIIG